MGMMGWGRYDWGNIGAAVGYLVGSMWMMGVMGMIGWGRYGCGNMLMSGSTAVNSSMKPSPCIDFSIMPITTTHNIAPTIIVVFFTELHSFLVVYNINVHFFHIIAVRRR
jgi:hypothetical protein